jgi:hypothetical protein
VKNAWRWACESESKDAEHDGPLVKVCREAGLRRVGWCVRRHIYASDLMMRGAGAVEVQEMLGARVAHEEEMRFAHLSPSGRRAARCGTATAPWRHREFFKFAK